MRQKALLLENTVIGFFGTVLKVLFQPLASWPLGTFLSGADLQQ